MPTTVFTPYMVPSSKSFGFSAETAFCLAAHSCLAYETDVPKLEQCLKGYGFSRFRFFCNSTSRTLQDTQAYAVSDKNVTVISFRGSEANLQDWIGTNAYAVAKDIPWLEAGAGKAHAGFINALTERGVSKLNILEEIEIFLKEELQKGRKAIYITGHSLGGALATLASTKFRGILVNVGSSDQLKQIGTSIPLVLYTFGSPRVVTSKLGAAYDEEMKKHTFRVIHENDIVTMIPYYRWGYRHVGTRVQLEDTGEFFEDPSNSENNLWGLYWGSTTTFAFSRVLLGSIQGGIGDHMIGAGPLGKDGPVPEWMAQFISNGGYLGSLAKVLMGENVAEIATRSSI